MVLGMTIGLIILLEVETWERWLAMTYFILQGIVFTQAVVLAVFHCYLGLYLYQTTLQFLTGSKGRVSPETQMTSPDSDRKTT